MRINLFVRSLYLSLVILLSFSTIALAAPFEFSVTAKKSFDTLVSSSGTKIATLLKKQYSDIQTLQKQEIDLDTKISSLHYKNEENEASIRKRLKSIDEAKIRSLESSAAKKKKQYEPLFSLYETQRSQLSLAKAAKNKELTSIVNAQVELTKIAVQAAKKDISAKEAAVKKAKSDASAKMKEIRNILADLSTPEARVKSAKSSANGTKKLFTAESKVLLQVVREGDASGTDLSLSRMIVYQRQILVQKSNMHYYEGQAADIVAKAEKKLKSY